MKKKKKPLNEEQYDYFSSHSSNKTKFFIFKINNFETDEKFGKQEKRCKNYDHVELKICEKLKILLNEETSEMETVC